MEYEVYGDLLFLVNFSMDFLAFYLCSRLLHRPLSPVRGILAATLGALYAIAALFSPLRGLPALAVDLAVCLLLCCIAMLRRGEHPLQLLRLGGAYLLISALLGGVMTLLSSQLNRTLSPDALPRESDGMGVFSLLASLAAAVVWLLCRVVRRTRATQTVTLQITENDNVLTLPALCDSGNLLRDPISARPVIPIDAHNARRIIPEAVLQSAAAEHLTDAVAALPPELARRVRLVPAKSALGAHSTLLLAWLPEHLSLQSGKSHREISAYLAPLPLNTAARGFCAIIPSELLS
ncbi:MAG: sigma-E processing peptidase SpoIIGA [Clostridia bacterium]|nr:sigma-E processing peptidase SpoIIGA [Clostridia bacterium]